MGVLSRLLSCCMQCRVILNREILLVYATWKDEQNRVTHVALNVKYALVYVSI